MGNLVSEPRVAIVTGGTRGIGFAIVEAFVERGYKVVTCGVENDDPGENLAPLVESGAVDYLRVDLALALEIERFFIFIDSKHDHIDILVNNAGLSVGATLSETDLPLWNRMLAVNLTAPFLLTHYYLPKMAERGWGRVINIASISGKIGHKARAAYASSKQGLIGLTRALAQEFGPLGVTVNAICPGATNTDMLADLKRAKPDLVGQLIANMPVGRLVEPKEIAALACYLCGADSAPLTGQTLVIDGGVVRL